MANQWNLKDIIQLTRDCELGRKGDTLHVISVSDVYMTVECSDGLWIHTGRDYTFAIKIGEMDDVSFSWIGDELTACDTKLAEVERCMRMLPTARRCADDIA